MVSLRQRAQGGLCVFMSSKRDCFLCQLLSLPAGSSHRRWEFTPLCPPTSFLGDLWLERGACLGLACLLLGKSGVLKGSDHFYHLALWEINFVKCALPLETFCPLRTSGHRREAGALHPTPPPALPEHLSQARPLRARA